MKEKEIGRLNEAEMLLASVLKRTTEIAMKEKEYAVNGELVKDVVVFIRGVIGSLEPSNVCEETLNKVVELKSLGMSILLSCTFGESLEMNFTKEDYEQDMLKILYSLDGFSRSK